MNRTGDLPNATARSRRDFLLSAAATAAVASVAVPAAQGQATASPAVKMKLGMVIFDGFQLLDVFGPLEMFGHLADRVEIVMIAQKAGLVRSSVGPVVIADHDFDTAPKLDIVMIPGGAGTRREVNNAPFVDAFKSLAQATPHVATICTGSAVLARTGLLDGVKATTNKRAWQWATGQGAKVAWVSQARWVEDGKYFTSSGISAGMDMALALIARLFGADTAQTVANRAEYRWHDDPGDDPFAKLNGLG